MIYNITNTVETPGNGVSTSNEMTEFLQNRGYTVSQIWGHSPTPELGAGDVDFNVPGQGQKPVYTYPE